MMYFNPIFRCGHNSTLNPGLLLHGIVLNLSSPKYLVPLILKGLFLSFRKIIKLDPRNSSYGD